MRFMGKHANRKGNEKKDLTKDHSPFTAPTEAFEREEDALADFVVHETPEQRIQSFVEDFSEEYAKNSEQVYQLLQDIYADLEEAGHVENAEEEIMEVLKRLQKTADRK